MLNEVLKSYGLFTLFDQQAGHFHEAVYQTA